MDKADSRKAYHFSRRSREIARSSRRPTTNLAQAYVRVRRSPVWIRCGNARRACETRCLKIPITAVPRRTCFPKAHDHNYPPKSNFGCRAEAGPKISNWLSLGQTPGRAVAGSEPQRPILSSLRLNMASSLTPCANWVRTSTAFARRVFQKAEATFREGALRLIPKSHYLHQDLGDTLFKMCSSSPSSDKSIADQSGPKGRTTPGAQARPESWRGYPISGWPWRDEGKCRRICAELAPRVNAPSRWLIVQCTIQLSRTLRLVAGKA